MQSWLIVPFFLSKFDNGYKRLGYLTRTDAFDKIGRRLGIKPSTIKNTRDEFDSIYSDTRKGWYQKPLIPSRVKVADMYDNLSEEALLEVVRHILSDKEYITENETDQNHSKEVSVSNYISRMRTGRAAEKYYIEHWKEISGSEYTLEDHRENGAGYDFILSSGTAEKLYMEVKGMSGENGQILITDKEWATAKQKGDKYFLVIVCGIGSENISVKTIKNPFSILKPELKTRAVIESRWITTI